MTADLPATPPADEALEGQIALTLQASGVYPYPQFVKSLVALFKSHTEQEKAAADLALAKEITWHIANLAYAHGFRGSPFIQNELKLAQERLAELRDGDAATDDAATSKKQD